MQAARCQALCISDLYDCFAFSLYELLKLAGCGGSAISLQSTGTVGLALWEQRAWSHSVAQGSVGVRCGPAA